MKKSLKKLLMIAVLCVSIITSINLTSINVSATAYRPGDVTGDDIINWDDYNLVDQYLDTEDPTLLNIFQLGAADVNFNGDVDWDDAEVIYNYCNGTIHAVPAFNNICTTSDIHTSDNTLYANSTINGVANIGDWIDNMIDDCFADVPGYENVPWLDYYVCAGDYHGDPTSGTTVEQAIQTTLADVNRFPSTPVILERGNHEVNVPANAWDYDSGLIVDPATHNYGLYVMNLDIPSIGSPDFSTSDINALGSILQNAPTHVPFFIVSHIPLHNYTDGGYTRTYPHAQEVVNLINNRPNVIFLYGHNHSYGTDQTYLTVKKPNNNDSIQCTYNGQVVNNSNIGFYYAPAGAMRDGGGPNFNRHGLYIHMDAVPNGSNVWLRYRTPGGSESSSTYIEIR